MAGMFKPKKARPDPEAVAAKEAAKAQAISETQSNLSGETLDLLRIFGRRSMLSGGGGGGSGGGYMGSLGGQSGVFRN